MELLLINHPLDCPVCDKGGECPLQNQAMSNGRGETRFEDVKRTFPKPIEISAQVLLDRERCVLCARCTRFSDQIAGDPFIELSSAAPCSRSASTRSSRSSRYFSGNTVQICPVGALTGAAYRFRSRPFDLVSTPSVCEHCAVRLRDAHRPPARRRSCAGWRATTRRSTRSGTATRAAGRSTYATQSDRLDAPLVRDADGRAAGGLVAGGARASRPQGLPRGAKGVGVLAGGRVTVEDAYAYAKFARVALRTNDIDFRARPHSAEEAAFLAPHVVATGPTAARSPTPTSRAPAVLLVGFEPEEESPIVFLRLRKARPQHQDAGVAIAPFATRGPRQAGRHGCCRPRPGARGRGPAATSAGQGRPRGAGRAPRAAPSSSSASGWRRSPAR